MLRKIIFFWNNHKLYRFNGLFLFVGLIISLYLMTFYWKDYFSKWQGLYGSLFGVIATILGVRISNKQVEKQKKREKVNNILVYFEECNLLLDNKLSIFRDKVYLSGKGNRAVKIDLHRVIYFYLLFEKKNKIIDFCQNVKSLLNNLISIISPAEIVEYKKRLDSIEAFVRKFNIQEISDINLVPKDILANSFKYYFFNGSEKCKIISDKNSIFFLIKFSVDCRQISYLYEYLISNVNEF